VKKIVSADSPFSLLIDEKSGMPTGLSVEDSRGSLSKAISVELVAELGGTEHRHPTGGLLYKDTTRVRDVVASGKISRLHKGECDQYQQTATLGPLDLVLQYRLYPTAPYFELAATISSANSTIVRNFHVDVTIEKMAGAVLNTPGNLLRRNLPIEQLGDTPTGIATLGSLRGSSGIIGITDAESTVVIWPNQPSEIPDVFLNQEDSRPHVTAQLNFAAEVSSDSAAELLLMTFNLERGDFELVRNHWPAWASRYGLTSPNDAPYWMHGSGIYEVQIGTSYFWKNNPYCRYPEIRDLTADLDRVQQMGFSVIQLMPRQPYPSYNVHDYADVTISYGDEKELR
jgi:hypothetical protein